MDPNATAPHSLGTESGEANNKNLVEGEVDELIDRITGVKKVRSSSS